MENRMIDSIYREILLLSESDRNQLYSRMKNDFFSNAEIVAYTPDGKKLTKELYKKRISDGIKQCMNNDCIGLEELSTELGHKYANL